MRRERGGARRIVAKFRTMTNKTKRKITAADLFCGAGGSSTGFELACRELGYTPELLAINHWDTAIKTHSANHPDARHMCMNVDQVDPKKAVPSGKLDLLIASPECTHHSIARGGKPINDQSRASAWLVLRWAEALDIKNVLIENVPEFMSWGPLIKKRVLIEDYENEAEFPFVPFKEWIKDAKPLGGTKAEWEKLFGEHPHRYAKKVKKYKLIERPDPKRKGKTFLAFINALESLGYTVKYQVLNAADYGDPTTRKRLFILARKGRRSVVFPEPTHSADGKADMFGKRKKWRAAKEIINWNLPGDSIFNRKKPLSPNTMRRIFAGLEKFSGGAFLVPFFGEYAGKSPRTHDVGAPLPAVTSHGAGGLVQPFLVSLRGTHDAALKNTVRSVDEPVATLTGNNHEYLAQPFVLNIRGGDDGYMRGASVNEPLQTITAAPAMALVEPFVLGQQSQARPRSTKKPLPTISTDGAIALVEPYIVSFHGGDGHEKRTHSVNEPVPTLDTSNRFGVAEPFLTEFHGSGVGVQPVTKPLPTQTTKDRFGLVEPIEVRGADGQVYLLDIRFRMLTPKELAAAMSFPHDYKFAGNREKVVKQIGNAVAVSVATALCKALLT